MAAANNEHESLVFVEAVSSQDGDESIEVVAESADPNQSGDRNEREDIAQAQVLPSKTKGGLYYSSEEGLNAGRNKVKSRPTIDEKIHEKMVRLAEILENGSYRSLHDVGKDARGLFHAAITHAKDNHTSLSSAQEILDKSLEMFGQACDIVAANFELSEACTKALAEYKRCERERQEFLKKSDMLEADEKREEGLTYLASAIEEGQMDVNRVLEKQRQEDAAQLLHKFEEEKKDIEVLVNNEIEGLSIMSDNCEGDIKKIGNSLKTLSESGIAAKKRFEETDADLDIKLKENADEQEELRRKLAELQRREKKLEEEKDARRGIQQIAEETERRARTELEKWNEQILELNEKCQAALAVMWQFKEGSGNLMDAAIKVKIDDSKRLHQLDIMAQRCLRDALAAAAVDRKGLIENCAKNLDFLKTQIKTQKDELRTASQTGLAVVVNDIKLKVQKYKDSYSQFQKAKQESEVKLAEYQNKMIDVDIRLQDLGQAVESFDDIYNRYVEEVRSAWSSEDNLGSLED